MQHPYTGFRRFGHLSRVYFHHQTSPEHFERGLHLADVRAVIEVDKAPHSTFHGPQPLRQCDVAQLLFVHRHRKLDERAPARRGTVSGRRDAR